MAIDKAEAREKFEGFLMNMDEQVEALQNEALTRHIDLGLTLSDSDKLEKLFNLMTIK